jgi:hypothetical protein
MIKSSRGPRGYWIVRKCGHRRWRIYACLDGIKAIPCVVRSKRQAIRAIDEISKLSRRRAFAIKRRDERERLAQMPAAKARQQSSVPRNVRARRALRVLEELGIQI